MNYFVQLKDERGFVTHESEWAFEMCEDPDLGGPGLLGWCVMDVEVGPHTDHFADPVPTLWDLFAAMCIHPGLGRQMPYMLMEPMPN